MLWAYAMRQIQVWMNGAFFMKIETQTKFLIKAAFYILIAALLFVGIKYLGPVLLPFLLAFLIVWVLRKPTLWLTRRLHVPQKVAAPFLLLLFYIALFCLFIFIGVQLLSAIRDWVPKLPGLYQDYLVPMLDDFSEFIKRWLGKADPSFAATAEAWFQQLTGSLEQTITDFSGTLMQWVSNFVLGFPSFIIKLLAMVVASFFLSGDYDKVLGFCSRHLPAKFADAAQGLPSKLKGSLWIYFRAYALLLCVTFLELLAGMLLLRVPYAPAIAAAIAIFDLLPILGTGGILIPWVVIAAVLGYYPMAIGVAVLYLVILVVRNTLEPRLIGKQIGLHPLATLISLFVGASLFGIVGLFALPVALSILVQVYRDKAAGKSAPPDTEAAPAQS